MKKEKSTAQVQQLPPTYDEREGWKDQYRQAKPASMNW